MPSLAPDWRDRVINDARGWLYTPYQHKGRVKAGVDCGGLIYQVYEPYLGPFKPFPTDYAPDWALHQENEIYLDFIMEYVEEVAAPVKAGLAMFQVGRNYSHGTICTGKNTYIHAWGGKDVGCVVEWKLHQFKIGNGGKPRSVRYYDVRKEWLLSHH